MVREVRDVGARLCGLEDESKEALALDLGAKRIVPGGIEKFRRTGANSAAESLKNSRGSLLASGLEEFVWLTIEV